MIYFQLEDKKPKIFSKEPNGQKLIETFAIIDKIIKKYEKMVSEVSGTSKQAPKEVPKSVEKSKVTKLLKQATSEVSMYLI